LARQSDANNGLLGFQNGGNSINLDLQQSPPKPGFEWWNMPTDKHQNITPLIDPNLNKKVQDDDVRILYEQAVKNKDP
jgi:hypothetical protein